MTSVSTKLTGLFICFALLLSGCASSYNSFKPEYINYNSRVESNDVVLQYKYDVLSDAGNKKYAKKEKKSLVQVVAVKITNNSDKVFDVSEDMKLFAGSSQFTPLDPNLVHKQLKQGVPIYLLYLLLTPAKLQITRSTTYGLNTDTYNIGYVLGPVITAYNLITAGTANQKFLQDLKQYSIANQKLMPGETIYGYVGIANSGYSPLTIQVGEPVIATEKNN